MRKLPALLAISSLALLASCGVPSAPVEKPAAAPERTSNVLTDPAVTALLPTGPNEFSINHKLGNFSTTVTGYVNFEDCSTEAEALQVNGAERESLELRNSGNGEAIRKAGGEWFALEDPQGPGLTIINILGTLSFTVEQERGAACSVLLLDDLAEVRSSDVDGSSSLGWDAARADAFVAAQADILGRNIFEAYGATPAEIAETAELRQTMFKIDISSMMEKTDAVITKDGESTIITIGRVGGETITEYRFTPTTKRAVSSVPYTPWYEKLKAESKASGLSFKEQL